MAHAAAACLRKARLVQLAEAQGTFAAHEGAAALERARGALHSLGGVMFSALNLPDLVRCGC